MESITPIIGGIAGLIVAVSGLITALRWVAREVQRELDRRRRQSALERRARDIAETVIYRLFGVVERGEIHVPETRAMFNDYLAMTDEIDKADSQEAGVKP